MADVTSPFDDDQVEAQGPADESNPAPESGAAEQSPEATASADADAPESAEAEASESADGHVDPEVAALQEILAKRPDLANAPARHPAPEPEAEAAPEPDPEDAPTNRDEFAQGIAQFSSEIQVLERHLAAVKKARDAYHAAYAERFQSNLSLHEINKRMKRITRTEDNRRLRVLENLQRLAETSNVRPRPRQRPIFPTP